MLLISSRMTTVLPTPAPPNAANFAAFRKRADQVDDLDAGLEDRRAGVLLGQLGSFAMDRVTLRKRNRPASVDRIAGNVERRGQASPRPPAP